MKTQSKFKNHHVDNEKLPDDIYKTLKDSFGSIVSIKKNLSALSNNVFYCETIDKQRFFLKLFRKEHKKFFNRKQELKIYNQNLAFVPKLLKYDLKRFYVFEYIDCYTAKDQALDIDNINDFAKNLAFFHKLSLGINKRNFYKTTELYLKDCLSKSDNVLNIDKNFYKNVLSIQQRIKNDLSKFSFEFALCHNDLNPNNILIDKTTKKLFFIDFEYSSYNDVYIDLVNAKKCCLPSNQDTFLKFYEKHSSFKIDEDKLRVYSNLVDYGDMIWYITYNHLEIAKEISNNLLANLSKNN